MTTAACIFRTSPALCFVTLTLRGWFVVAMFPPAPFGPPGSSDCSRRTGIRHHALPLPVE